MLATFQSLNRTERGLNNLGGSTLDVIFGLATEDDMRQIHGAIGNLLDIQDQQGRMIKKQNEFIDQ